MLPLSMLLYVVCSWWIREEANWELNLTINESNQFFLLLDWSSYWCWHTFLQQQWGSWVNLRLGSVGIEVRGECPVLFLEQFHKPECHQRVGSSCYQALQYPQRRILQALLCNILLFDKMSFACQMCFFVEVIASLVTSINSIYF